MTDLKSFDRVAHCYDETRAMPPDVTAQVADAISAVLGEVAERPQVIEVGIGTGRIAVPLAERGARITGIDISPQMIAVLRSKRSDIGVMLAESSRPPLRGQVFDAALFVHILHLVPDAEATVRATVPLVRPGGVIIRGQEERPEGSLDQVMGDILQRTTREALGLDLWGRAQHEKGMAAYERVVTDAGCAIELRHVAAWERPTTAREVLDGMVRKDGSGSWQIPDDRMPELRAAIEPPVVEWFGGIDVPRAAARRFDLTIARLPAA